MQGGATASASNEQEMKPSEVLVQKQKCPRCDSSNTKFCYYNNYSLSQPRYFCKSCRRYWTHGGTLRNVPIGGGSRKSKRPKTIIPPSSSSSSSAPLNPPPTSAPVVDTSYLPSLEAIHSTLITQNPPPQILINQPSSVVDVGVYSFGLSEQNWAHRSFADDVHNPAWTTLDNPIHSSSPGNNINSSVESENNCCNLVPNHHLPPYPHPP